MLLFLLPLSCHVATDEHQQFWSDRHSPGLLRASFLPVGGEKRVVNVLFVMASQVVKEWWRKRQEGLVFQRCIGFPSLHVTGQRSSPPHTPMPRLPLSSQFNTLCSCPPYYMEGTWRGPQQNKFSMKLLQLFPTDFTVGCGVGVHEKSITQPPHFQVCVKNRISVAHLTGLASQRVFLLNRPWTFWHG